MKILTVIPTQVELNAFLKACQEQGYPGEAGLAGGLPVTAFPEMQLTVALGGVGKKRLRLRTQELIAAGDWDLVLCAGAAGALAPGPAKRDVVIATETVEYDLRKKLDDSSLPRYPGSEAALRLCRQTLKSGPGFRMHYGPVASGDEFLMTGLQRAAVYQRTHALVAAMEGAGAALACQQSGLAFLEIRAVTDQGNLAAVFDFVLNVKAAMKNIAQVAISLARARDEGLPSDF
jgi:adenosylhomocysteine nucleosidase